MLPLLTVRVLESDTKVAGGIGLGWNSGEAALFRVAGGFSSCWPHKCMIFRIESVIFSLA